MSGSACYSNGINKSWSRPFIQHFEVSRASGNIPYIKLMQSTALYQAGDAADCCSMVWHIVGSWKSRAYLNLSLSMLNVSKDLPCPKDLFPFFRSVGLELGHYFILSLLYFLLFFFFFIPLLLMFSPLCLAFSLREFLCTLSCFGYCGIVGLKMSHPLRAFSLIYLSCFYPSLASARWMATLTVIFSWSS